MGQNGQQGWTPGQRLKNANVTAKTELMVKTYTKPLKKVMLLMLTSSSATLNAVAYEFSVLSFSDKKWNRCHCNTRKEVLWD